jgi:hypothetical protein
MNAPLRNPDMKRSILDSVGAKFRSPDASSNEWINHKDKGVPSAALIRNEA